MGFLNWSHFESRSVSVLRCVDVSSRGEGGWLRGPYINDLYVDGFLAQVDLLADSAKITKYRC